MLAYTRSIESLEQHIRRRSAGGGISDVGNAESTRQLLQESKSVEFRKDLLRHSEALSLVDSTPVANRDAGSILTSLFFPISPSNERFRVQDSTCVLQIKETLVEFDGSRSGLRVSELDSGVAVSKDPCSVAARFHHRTNHQTSDATHFDGGDGGFRGQIQSKKTKSDETTATQRCATEEQWKLVVTKFRRKNVSNRDRFWRRRRNSRFRKLPKVFFFF